MRTNLKRRLTSMILAIIMVAALFTFGSMPILADDYDDVNAAVQIFNDFYYYGDNTVYVAGGYGADDDEKIEAIIAAIENLNGFAELEVDVIVEINFNDNVTIKLEKGDALYEYQGLYFNFRDPDQGALTEAWNIIYYDFWSEVYNVIIVGGDNAEDDAKAAAIKAKIEALEGFSATGVTVTIEHYYDNRFMIQLEKGSFSEGEDRYFAFQDPDQGDVYEAWDNIVSGGVGYQIGITGGNSVTNTAKAAAIKAKIEALEGFSATGVTVTVEHDSDNAFRIILTKGGASYSSLRYFNFNEPGFTASFATGGHTATLNGVIVTATLVEQYPSEYRIYGTVKGKPAKSGKYLVKLNGTGFNNYLVGTKWLDAGEDYDEDFINRGISLTADAKDLKISLEFTEGPVGTINYWEEMIWIDEYPAFYSVGKTAEAATGDKAKWYPAWDGGVDISRHIPKKPDGKIYIGLKSVETGATSVVEVGGRPDPKSLKTVAKGLFNAETGLIKNTHTSAIQIFLSSTPKWEPIWLEKDEVFGGAEEFSEINPADMFPFGDVATVRIAATDNTFASNLVKFKIPAQAKAPDSSKMTISDGVISGVNEKMFVFAGFDNTGTAVWKALKKDMTVEDFIKLGAEEIGDGVYDVRFKTKKGYSAQGRLVIPEKDMPKGD